MSSHRWIISATEHSLIKAFLRSQKLIGQLSTIRENQYEGSNRLGGRGWAVSSIWKASNDHRTPIEGRLEGWAPDDLLETLIRVDDNLSMMMARILAGLLIASMFVVDRLLVYIQSKAFIRKLATY